MGPAYAIERELGGGGMSRVFLATEAALGRQVVVKVLPPELAAGLSADRFRREIHLAARLQHPHIVPVLAAGEAGEFLFYTMPFVAGESLRARLQRQGELPVPLAARFMTEIARALAYAHRQGVVHRDIKPENVLLAEEEAQVADFGIAKAVSASAKGTTLTSVGLAIGTPAYMAPEQAAADATADHRADLYALGVVAYEMIAGQPPFSGRTAAQLLSAHATQQPPPLVTLRPTVPAALADLVMRLLEKRPADRPQTADEVLGLLESAVTPGQALPTVPVPTSASELVAAISRSPPRRGRWILAGGLAALALVTSLAWLRSRERPVAIDRRVVAVAPFRVSGADSSLAYLREGMVDLLAAKLSGTSAITPADPRTVLARWRRAAGGDRDLPQEDAVRVAAAVGAGQLLEGDVVGNRQRVTLNATLIDASGGRVRARASAEGSGDSLTQLVDRLAASLLALGAGEGEQRVAALTSTSLPALRAYLNGQALLRRGLFVDAARMFTQALQLDSTFALAALGIARAEEWGNNSGTPEAIRLAWRYRDRLSPKDRVHLEVYAGPRFLSRPGFLDQIKAAERFAVVAPDGPDAWYKLADNLFHYGPLVGLPDPHRRAAQAFSRSLTLDSSYAPTLQHLSEMAAALGDTAGVVRGFDLLRRVDSLSPIAAARRWHVAAYVGDTAEARHALENDSILSIGPFHVVFYSLDQPLTLTGTDGLYARGLARSATADEQSALEVFRLKYDLIRGHPARGHRYPAHFFSEMEGDAITLLDALFADGDATGGTEAAKKLESQIGRPVAGNDFAGIFARYAVGQHGLASGRRELARRALADLRNGTAAPDSAWQLDLLREYALMLEAQLASAEGSSTAGSLLRQLDSVLANPLGQTFASYGNLVSARLHESRGEPEAALAAARRRLYGIASFPHYVSAIRQEGRLAALVGDRAGAIRAYRHYLALRDDPDPPLRPQRDSVLAELRALERESTDRP
ncbi:MAG TPA: serine/threonine-protein kinase [Gemmatimonadales bacterium]|nr:serine/threonine-protein kinase [Gemmatimonadales bacterium]